MESVNWQALLLGAFCVIGVTQWLKNYIPEKFRKWALPLVSVIAAILWGIAPQYLKDAGAVLAIAQIGYENIIQIIDKKLKQ